MKIIIMCFDSDLIRRTQGIIIFRKVSLLIKVNFFIILAYYIFSWLNMIIFINFDQARYLR